MRHFDRRTVLLAALSTPLYRVAKAQAIGSIDTFPNRPVRWVVPTPPGTPPDIRARHLAQKLSEEWQQSVVVENRPGASEKIGMDIVANAPADGYTMLLGAFGMASVSHLTKLPYDPLEVFAPVTKIAVGPLMLAVNAASPFNSVADLVAYARIHPGKLSGGSAGVGNILHLALALLSQSAGVEFTHVPYSTSSSQLNADVASGQVNFMFNAAAVTLPFVKSGRMKVLAVANETRLAPLPDVPTFRESGYPAVEVVGWYGAFVRAGTPSEVIAKMNAALVKAIRSPDFRQTITDAGSVIGADTPEQFGAFVRSESAKWGKVISAAGIRLE